MIGRGRLNHFLEPVQEELLACIAGVKIVREWGAGHINC